MSEPLNLTDADFMRRLETLNLLARKVLGGALQLDRRSQRKGSGITFAEHAEYQPGDDYRAIDWRVYARNEQLMIKLFEMEEDMTLHLLLDVSPSMASKFDLARQIVAALAISHSAIMMPWRCMGCRISCSHCCAVHVGAVRFLACSRLWKMHRQGVRTLG